MKKITFVLVAAVFTGLMVFPYFSCETSTKEPVFWAEDLVVEEPGTEDPDAEEPGAEESGAEDPDAEEPGTEEPVAEKPGTEKPGTEKPAAEEPDTEKPGTEKPAAEKPDTEKPSTEDPGTEKPSTEKPSTEKPSTEKPGTEKPSTEKPAVEKPDTEKPSTEKPGTEEPAAEKPGTEDPVAEEPGAEEPGTEDPGTEDPGAEDPDAEEPGTGIVPSVSPKVKEIFFLTKRPSGIYQYFTYDTDAYWNNIVTGECGLSILFDQEMNLSEPTGSLRMEPARDYTTKAINSKTLEVYFKAEASPVKKISLTVKSDLRSLAGVKLDRDYTFGFTEWTSDFAVTQIKINGGSAVPLSQLNKPYLVEADYYKGDRFTDVAIQTRGSPLSYNVAESILSEIELVPADGSIDNALSVLGIQYEPPNYTKTWAGVEFGSLDSPYRYLLKIPGGIEGVNNGNGYYLKEDMTLMLDVFSK
jgi:hypothetical protein